MPYRKLCVPIIIVTYLICGCGVAPGLNESPVPQAQTDSQITIESPTPASTPTTRPSITPSPTSTQVPTPTRIPPDVSSYQISRSAFQVSRNQFNTGLGLLAIAYADIDRDGFQEVFAASVSGTETGIPVTIFHNDGTNHWQEATGDFISGDIPTSVHPRKAIVADFNGDGFPDVYVSDHGYDKPPWPGGKNVLLLSDGSGHLAIQQVKQDRVGFHHGAAAADIDRDGDVDIFVTEGYYTEPSYFLINDSTGNFSINTSFPPSSIRWVAIYTAELIDIDGDSNIDLLVGGHEFEDVPTSVFFGNGSGQFRDADRIILPQVPDFGVVVDIDAEDLDGDGLRDLVITRTGSPPKDYNGYYIQILIQDQEEGFSDESMERIIDDLSTWSGRSGNWIFWIRLIDIDKDGSPDILVDDASRGLTWLNDGNGYFNIE
jgi:hypothetical protein